MTLVVGLTGGIGSGKSTVADMFEKLGATLIDADAIVHELQAPDAPALAEIAEAFGAEMIDATGALDREALGALVFADPQARTRLGSIMHPKVGVEMARRLATAQTAGAPLVIVDIPLLFEGRERDTGSAARFGFAATVLVFAPEETQIERQLQRETYDRAEAERRVRAQMPLAEKRELADHVIDNTGSLEDTRAQVQRLWQRLMSPAATP